MRKKLHANELGVKLLKIDANSKPKNHSRFCRVVQKTDEQFTASR